MATTIEPNFDRYALALIQGDRIVFTSEKLGLEPILECIEACRGRYRDCILHDRVFGLAAARLIVPAELIRTLVTRAISRPALAYSESRGIVVHAEAVVERILTRDRSRVCPGEVIALETDDPELFTRRIGEMMRR
ncbi:MAG: DUF1893 domain-containing protein [Syntrophaceae bacterium]|nr:DUF1893 domain-containing protein [Syntrophaceae bacterium]